jgi:hypothetical protein
MLAMSLFVCASTTPSMLPWLPIADGNFSVVFGALETDYAFSRFLSLST